MARSHHPRVWTDPIGRPRYDYGSPRPALLYKGAPSEVEHPFQYGTYWNPDPLGYQAEYGSVVEDQRDVEDGYGAEGERMVWTRDVDSGYLKADEQPANVVQRGGSRQNGPAG